MGALEVVLTLYANRTDRIAVAPAFSHQAFLVQELPEHRPVSGRFCPVNAPATKRCVLSSGYARPFFVNA